MNKPNFDKMSALDALKMAINALNMPPNFQTYIAAPDQVRPGKYLKSYDLIPYLESVVRREESK